MDKNAIKKYAVCARRELISRVSQKALQYGISEESTVPASAASVNGVVLSADEIKQRKALIERISKEGYQQVMEEVAYTWFNRFAALRFMEVNGYLPSRVRVFTDDENNFKPQILTEAINMELEGLDRSKVYALKNANDDDTLFKYLIIVQCNALSGILPGMFQRISDYTELLFPDNLLREGSVIQQMIAMIPEKDWTDQVQIIGWLYQYYNTEPKDKVFADLKKNIKITKENIPAATQLFTPDWIVRYMVENSLGRLWIEHLIASGEGYHYCYDESGNAVASSVVTSESTQQLKSKWKYYLEEAEQEPQVQVQLTEIRKEYAAITPAEIKCIDPCMGSGHILCYLFDILVRIYEDYGYSAREAVRSIVEKNLWGLDIDQRAAQLAYFAVMMKARQYDRRFLNRKNADGYPDVPQSHVYAIVESNGIDPNAIAEFVGGDPALKKAMDSILKEMRDAKEYGSILNITPVDFEALYTRFDQVYDEFGLSRGTILDELLPLVRVAETLARRYGVVVTNPPYMVVSNAGAKVQDYVKKNYPDSKADLFAVFIERCGQFAGKNGYQAMITQHAWMFLSSFEKLRAKLQMVDTVNMAHLGARAFEEIGGEVVQTTSFVMRESHIKDYKGIYCRLIEPTTQQGKENMFLAGENRYTAQQDNFSKIPGSPVAYWLTDNAFRAFSHDTLNQIVIASVGIQTGDNEKFVHYWWEIIYQEICFSAKICKDSYQDKNWFPYNKGGEYRKWSGNDYHVVLWKNDGEKIKTNSVVTGHHYQQYSDELKFRPLITWSRITTGTPAFRYKSFGYLSDMAGFCLYTKGRDLKFVIALCNSAVANYYLAVLAPTLNIMTGQVLALPFSSEIVNKPGLISKVNSCIAFSKADWDSFETSWDFTRHPLITHKQYEALWGDRTEEAYANVESIKLSYSAWERECDRRFNQLKANEEELNRIFIGIYDLQDELTPEVADRDITVHRVYDTKGDVPESINGSNYVRTKRDEIVSLISYAVGCMFGRYSIYKDGLIFAGGEWDYNRYENLAWLAEEKPDITEFYNRSHFFPDQDGIIPICDDEYFRDDIVGRFIQFIEVVYGKDTLEENLRFIADALGGKGQPKDVIRNYFLNDFYADHLKTYQKRPIYWLFDSGKKNGFKCLIYMHRYQADTIARIRTDYVHEQQYRTAIADLEQRIQGASTDQRVKLTKQLQKIQAQAEEVRVYEEKIHHLADQYISIDLDDGVKVNYAKFQDVLARIK